MSASARRALPTRTNAIPSAIGASGGRSARIATAPAASAAFDEAQAVGLAAGDRDEDVAAFDRAAVRRHPADVEIGIACLDVDVGGQNFAQLHGGSLCA